MERKFLFWSDRYNTGIEHIDKLRKNIFSIVENLYSKIGNGEASSSIILTALFLLKEECEQCFMLEEDFMAKIRFPYYPFHRSAHKSILIKIEGYIELIEQSEGDIDLYAEIFDFLNKIIVEHLFEEDNYIRIYIEFIKHCKKYGINVLEIKL